MCFSATADLGGGIAVTALGAATLTRVRRPRELALGALPVLLGVHQLVEAAVWWGLQGRVPAGVGATAAEVYVLFAHCVLPVLVPVAVVLVEPRRRRRAAHVMAVVAGTMAAAYLSWADLSRPLDYHLAGRSIAYANHAAFAGQAAVLYVLATCGAALVSSHRWIVGFGVANLAGLSVTAWLLQHSFTSVWCGYAAVVSAMIAAFFFHDRRARTWAGAARSAREFERARSGNTGPR